MRVLKVIYVLAIAALLILLVVVGVEAFYPAPAYPDCYELLGPQPEYGSPDYEDWMDECTNLYDAHQQEAAGHDKNVFCIVLPLGVVFAVAGTFLQRKSGIFGAGLILGGIGTMIFATVPYDLSMVLRFIGVAVILAVLIFVGYRAFLSSRRS
jgi:hypothetical protein